MIDDRTRRLHESIQSCCLPMLLPEEIEAMITAVRIHDAEDIEPLDTSSDAGDNVSTKNE